MRTGFINRPGVTYDALQLDRFYAEDIQAIADVINNLPASFGDVVGPDGCDANTMAFFSGATGKIIGASPITMPVPGDLFSAGTLEFQGGLISDWFNVGKQMIVNGAVSADLEGINLCSNVTPGKRVDFVQSFESGAGEFYLLNCVNRAYNGSAYTLLDDTSKKGGLLIMGTAENELLRVYSFNANSTTAIQRLALSHTGYFGIGTANPQNKLTVSGYTGTLPSAVGIVQIIGDDAEATAIVLDSIANQTVFGARRANGTHASKTALLNNDQIGAFGFSGYDGANYTNSRGGIKFFCAENWSSTANGNYIFFSTCPNGSATVGGVERMRIDQNGNIGIGNNPNANAILDVASTTKAVLFPRMTTTQRDAIASPVEGMLIYNTTTHVFNFRNASAWAAI